MSKRVWIVAFALGLSGCAKPGSAMPQNHAGPSAPAAPGRSSEVEVDTPAFHLEIARVYERFGDLKTAADHLAKAAREKAPVVQRAQAYAALGRVKEAMDDPDGAIDALEKARALGQGKPAPAPRAAMPMPADDDIASRLGRLYVRNGRNDDAERLYAGEAATSSVAPWQRDQFIRAEVELLRRANRLDGRIAEAEKALEDQNADEASLRFLAVAYDRGVMPAVKALPRAARESSGLDKLARVYAKLHRLHPEDQQVRQTLVSLYERTGKTDQAVAVAVQPPQHAATGLACAGAIMPPVYSPALTGEADAIRIRIRAGQKDAALAQTSRLIAMAKREGAPAFLLAAELYLEQKRADLAMRAIPQARAAARTLEERRQVAAVRERTVERSANHDAAKALLAEWKTSEDPCLRMIVAQREQQMKVMAAPPAAPSTPGL